ncbi:hypothetical protein [Bacillus paranthracis]|uniref:hypothetical protein n=1 Tax=Bacillus paranthracis TaxID=2026186 RepID=UPI0022E115C5|nr:hypothetical protein [Bacillus paranthracis]
MIEILVQGHIDEILTDLGLSFKQTYGGKYDRGSYKVYELPEEDFDKLSKDKTIAEYRWATTSWRWAKGSNLEEPTEYVVVNGNHLKGWINEEHYKPYTYTTLTNYLEEVLGCTAPRNVCAVATDLAKYNHMSMASLFRIYQGGDYTV